MSLIWIVSIVTIFIVLEAVMYARFKKNKKFSEVLNIVAFLICAWMVTDSSTFIMWLGGVLLVVAIILDMHRRQINRLD